MKAAELGNWTFSVTSVHGRTLCLTENRVEQDFGGEIKRARVPATPNRKRNLFRPGELLSVDRPGLIGVRRRGYVEHE